MKRRVFVQLSGVYAATALLPGLTGCSSGDVAAPAPPLGPAPAPSQPALGSVGDAARAFASDGSSVALSPAEHLVEIYSATGDLRARIGDPARVGSRAVGTLNAPSEAAWDVDGRSTRLLVLERGNRRVQAFDAAGAPLGIVLTTGAPSDLLVDPIERAIYVSLHTTHRIEVYAPNGTPLRTIGSFGTDTAGLNGPLSIALAKDGALHVVDAGSASVKVFADGRYVAQYGGKDAPGSARLVAPTSIRFDGADRAWVADLGAGVIRIYDRGAYVSQVRPRTAAGGPAAPLRLATRPDGSVYAAVAPSAPV